MYTLASMLHKHDCSIACRFIVAQNRQAVHVLDPLRLAHRLEVLGGTAIFVELIADKQILISQHSKDCTELTEASIRSVGRKLHICNQKCWHMSEC